MSLADLLGVQLRLREALAIGFFVAALAGLIITPRAIKKLRGAGIMGVDRHKPGRPQIPEMGGLAVFLAFNMGAFVVLAFSELSPFEQVLVLASLITISGAALTGTLDDLIALRQRFKAAIPFAFAIPLALYVEDTTLTFLHLGTFDLGIAYAIILVPVAVACASNAFNMLEGFNGLGTGLGIIMSIALGIIILLSGNHLGLVLLMPLAGALVAFWFFNAYPAKVFPGDTMTLMVGATLAAAAILSKVEFWAGLLFLPHMVEFVLKALGRFEVQSFASRQQGDLQVHEGPIRSLPHVVMKLSGPVRESTLVHRMHFAYTAYGTAIVGAMAYIARTS